MTMRVHGCLADRHGPGYYRIWLPLSRMTDIGHNATHGSVMPTVDEVAAAGLDVMVGQRLCEPSPSGRWQRLAKERPCKLVMELDDDLWHIDPSNDAYGFFDADRLRRLRENVEVCDLVTVSTEPLAEVVRPMNPNVVVLRNTVPEWLTEFERPRDPADVVIGWAGSSTHNRDFGECAKPLKRVLQARRDTVFHCVSSADYTPRVASIKGRTRHTGWIDGGVEAYLKSVDFDMGLAPLHPSPFNDCKSDLRLLELAALGIPAVVSATGPYQRALDEGYPALAASTPKQWGQALTELAADEERREQLGKDAREWVASRTAESCVDQWIEAYASVLET